MVENRKQVTVKDFIREALNEISSALVEFEEGDNPTGMTVFIGTRFDGDRAPPDLTKVGVFMTAPFRGNLVMPVQFDLQVEVASDKASALAASAKAEGRGSILSVIRASADVGGTATRETTEAETTTQRVRFTVPLQLPNDEDREQDAL